MRAVILILDVLFVVSLTFAIAYLAGKAAGRREALKPRDELLRMTADALELLSSGGYIPGTPAGRALRDELERLAAAQRRLVS